MLNTPPTKDDLTGKKICVDVVYSLPRTGYTKEQFSVLLDYVSKAEVILFLGDVDGKKYTRGGLKSNGHLLKQGCKAAIESFEGTTSLTFKQHYMIGLITRTRNINPDTNK